MKDNANSRIHDDNMAHVPVAPASAGGQPGRPSFVASVFLSLITFYQRYLSAGHPACCRFSPTCSAYAAQAIGRHGAIRGTGLAVWRVFRCNPFSKGGYDPVPEKRTKNSTIELPREQRGRLIGITRK